MTARPRTLPHEVKPQEVTVLKSAREIIEAREATAAAWRHIAWFALAVVAIAGVLVGPVAAALYWCAPW